MGHLPPYPSGEAAPTSHPGSVPAAQKGPRWAQEQLDRRNRALGARQRRPRPGHPRQAVPPGMRRCGVRAAQDLVAAVQRQASHTRRRGRSHPGTGPGREVVAQAASARRQITVRDVGTATVFDEAPRQAILQTGSRAAHSVPPDHRQGPRAGHGLLPPRTSPARLQPPPTRRVAADGDRCRPVAVLALGHRCPGRPGAPPRPSCRRLPLTHPAWDAGAATEETRPRNSHVP